MEIRKSTDPSDLLVETRVVLHRARPERIHAHVDRIIPGRYAREVPDHIDLADFRNTVEIIIAPQCSGNDLVKVRFFDIELGQSVADAAGLRALEDQSFVL